MEAASTLVIKVKYGDVLRRFNARVDEELDLSVDGLREKISSLFSFSPESELVLTYIDEDGDVVTLVEDAELRDVVKQALNPLRITVKLKAEKYGHQVSCSSGNSTPLRSLHVQKSNPTSDLSEIQRTLQETARETLVKLAVDVASKYATSVRGVAELSDFKTKEQPNDTPKISAVATGTKDAGESKIDNTTSKVLESEEESTKGKESLKEPQSESSMECSKMESGNVTSSSKASGPKAVPSSVSSKTTSAGKNKAVMKASACSSGDKSQTTSSDSCGTAYLSGGNNIPAKQAVNKASKPFSKPKTPNVIGSLNFPGLLHSPISPYQYSSSRIPVGGMPSVPPHPASRDFLFMGSNHYGGRRVITHHGVRCDCCGVHPITGPRFNSTVKEDFDLCEICYDKMGNDKDYIKMDYPGPGAYHTLKSFKNVLYNAPHYYPAPNIPQTSSESALKIGGVSKLSSRFTQDVNVVDGTFLAPLTSFTKIWRMRNNGNVVWPKKTQLVWVGGDKLCNGISFKLDIPEAGIAVDQELDVAVDFISPERPGRYISYWRMASPYGQMFGQRVWVLIQVDASLKDIENIVRNFNLNSLPSCNDPNGHEINVEDLEPMVEDSLPHSGNSNNTVQSVQPVLESQPNVDHEKKVPINDSLLVGNGASSSVSSPNPNSVPYPNIGFSNVGSVFSSVPPPPPVVFVSPPPPPYSVVFPKSPAQEIPKEVERGEKLLRQLENMGFKKVDLNKEILRLNEYDLVKTMNDLCGVEWDPMLEDLHEMGFTDKKMNKMLLKKNSGSIKRVVMDLIAEDKI